MSDVSSLPVELVDLSYAVGGTVLLDRLSAKIEAGAPTMVWTLANAWPTKITGTDLKSDGNEAAIETIEISHEGITIGND